MTQRLAQPGAVAFLEATRLRGEARQHQQRMGELLEEADAAEHADRLAQERDRAAGALAAARGEVPALAREVRKARGREQAAAEAERDARENFTQASRAEEAARRTGAPAAVRTEALVRMNAAGAVAETDQAALRGATSALGAATAALDAAKGRVAGLEAALASARAAEDSPGRAPRSAITLTMTLLAAVHAGDLTDAEQALVRALGEALATYSGAAEDIAARAVERAERDRTERGRKQATFLRPLGDGGFAAIANPATGGRPVT